MKMLIAVCFCIFSQLCQAQSLTDTIQLNFLYGSVPRKEYKDSEKRLFGGLKGGHVNISAAGRVLDFRPEGNCSILPNDVNPNGGFYLSNAIYWDTTSTKWMIVRIPVSREQMVALQSLFDNYSRRTPYDYAVFGMRCAAASYDVLSEIGLFRKLSQKNNIVYNFYPKLLRKRIYRWAVKNNFPVMFHEGRGSRKWESDEGIF